MQKSMNRTKVVLWGFGAMGQGIAKLCLKKPTLKIAGVCDINPKIVGLNAGSIIDEQALNDVLIEADINAILERTKPDIVMISTDSFVKTNYKKIVTCLKHKCHVISSAEEMAHPYANNSELALKIDRLAKDEGVSVLGTGVNPGFMMDLLAIVMSGVCEDIKEIHCRRVNSLSPFGKTVMEEQGIGITLDEFNTRMTNNDLAGHVGFKESTYLFAQAFGKTKVLDFKEEMTPIITDVDRRSKYGFAAKGTLAGIDMRAKAKLSNGISLVFEHPQQIEPHLAGIQTGDFIHIKGTPEVKLSIQPEVDGGIGTIAVCVNMIPLLIEASPGLKTMVDLPVPRAIMSEI